METGTVIKNGEFVTCPNCEEFIKRMHSLQSDRLSLVTQIKELKVENQRMESAIKAVAE